MEHITQFLGIKMGTFFTIMCQNNLNQANSCLILEILVDDFCDQKKWEIWSKILSPSSEPLLFFLVGHIVIFDLIDIKQVGNFGVFEAFQWNFFCDLRK